MGRIGNAVGIGLALGAALVAGYWIGATGCTPLLYVPLAAFEGGAIHRAWTAVTGRREATA